MCNGVVTGVDSFLTKAQAAGKLQHRGSALGWQQHWQQHERTAFPSFQHQQQYPQQPQQTRDFAQHVPAPGTSNFSQQHHTQQPNHSNPAQDMSNARMGFHSQSDGSAAGASPPRHHAHQAQNISAQRVGSPAGNHAQTAGTTHPMYHAQQAPNGRAHSSGYSAQGAAGVSADSTSYPMHHVRQAPHAMGHTSGHSASSSAQFMAAQNSHQTQCAQQVPQGMAHNSGHSASSSAQSMAAQTSYQMQSAQQVLQGLAHNPGSPATGYAGHTSGGSAPSMYPTQQTSPGMGLDPRSGTVSNPAHSPINSRSQWSHPLPTQGASRGFVPPQASAVHLNCMRGSASSPAASPSPSPVASPVANLAHSAEHKNVLQQSKVLPPDRPSSTPYASCGSDASSSSIPHRIPSPSCSNWPSGMSVPGASAAQLHGSGPTSYTNSPSDSRGSSQQGFSPASPQMSHLQHQAVYSHGRSQQVYSQHLPQMRQVLQQASLPPQQATLRQHWTNGMNMCGQDLAGLSANMHGSSQQQFVQNYSQMSPPGQHMSQPGRQASPCSSPSLKVPRGPPGSPHAHQQQQQQAPQQMSHPSQQMGHHGQQIGGAQSRLLDPYQIGNAGSVGKPASHDVPQPEQVYFDSMHLNPGPSLAQTMSKMTLDHGLDGRQGASVRR